MKTVIDEIKCEFRKTDYIGVEITNTDLLQKFARQMRLCYHKGLLCENPPVATRGRADIGDDLELIVKEGRLYIIDRTKYKSYD